MKKELIYTNYKNENSHFFHILELFFSYSLGIIVIVDERYRYPFSHPPITYIFNPLFEDTPPQGAFYFYFFKYQVVVVLNKISYTSTR